VSSEPPSHTPLASPPIRARELLEFLLPLSPPILLSAQNNAGSTALHWAALNAQLATARALVAFPDGPGARLIDVKNAAGRSPLGEAEAAGWDEGAKWMVEVMRLDDDDGDCGDRGARGAVEEDGEEPNEQYAGGRVVRTPSSAVEQPEVEGGVSPQP
jgi:ankyrin repeat protein